MHVSRRVQLVSFALVVVLTFGSAAVVAQADTAFDAQLATAIQHTELAMGADDHAMAMRHLGHVLNCIAGEDGEGFDGSWGHPCGAQGSGILNDIEGHAHQGDVMALLHSAHALAMDGVDADSIGAVHAAAAGVRALLLVLRDHEG
ncbi:hypothetical protein BH23DEI1_BH23DEI1_04190 [soil metagenome]